MIKEKDILIRISSELKEKTKQKAKHLGLSTSAFIRMLIIKEVENGK
jgi:antitoxin component of RelBE/YafQ-DinJ toxin-antitoxin module